MNKPPDEYTPVPAPVMRDFVRAVFEHAGVPTEKAAFLSQILVDNDLRGVFSHGTRQTSAYVNHFNKGELTPDPEVTVVDESPTTLILDGGGGLGYYASHRLTNLLIPKAQQMGIAIGITRNHGHFGAAGIYARLPLSHDLFCYVTSGHQLHLKPGNFFMHAAGGSPMAFGLPTQDEPPFVLDFGAIHDFYGSMEEVAKIAELAPSTVFRSFGLGCVCQALGGFLCGVPVDPARAQREWPGANQGSLVIVVDLNRFMPIAQFKAEMDEYSRIVRQMKPLPGYESAMLAGTLEWKRAQQYAETGIPVSRRHAEALKRLAADCQLTPPV
jgi:L-2-hydroxycarboxylate dehydrogenase (NAD+)